MAFAEGFERGGRMAQGIIGTYRDANQRARERAAEEEIAALNEQYARSGEMIEAPPPRTGLRPDRVSGALPVNLNQMQPTTTGLARPPLRATALDSMQPLAAHSARNTATGRTMAFPGGGTASVQSGSVQDERLNGGRPTLIPFVYDGQIVSGREAIERAVASGKQWPSYDTNEEATIYSKQLSRSLGNIQQPVQQMLRQVATPASGGLTARMNTEAAAVAERPVRATPTPPAQSQIYQQQADVYSRYGLTDQARSARDLGLQAERDEERMRVDEERYQTGLEFQQSAEERAQAREARETAADEYTQAQRKATDEAFAAYAAGGNLDELMDNPSVDQMALLQFAATRGSLQDQETARALRDSIDAGTAKVAEYFSINGVMPTYQDLAGIAVENSIPVSALMGPALEAAGYTKETAVNYAAGVRQAINGAGNITAANKVLKDSIGGLLDPNPADNVFPEFVEIDLDTGELKPGTGAWTVKYGDNILPETGVFRGRPGLPGWKLMLTQLGEQFNPDGDPIGMYARIQGIFPDAEPPLTFDSKDYIAVFKQLSERERPLTKTVEGEEVVLTPEELWQEAGRIIRGEVDPGLPGLDELEDDGDGGGEEAAPPIGLRPQAGAVTPSGGTLARSTGGAIVDVFAGDDGGLQRGYTGATQQRNIDSAEAVKRKIASGNLRAAGFFERNQYQAALNSGILTPEEAAEVRFALGQTTPE